MRTRDNTEPASRWAFDAEVTDAFDDMLERSIPQYDVMRSAVTGIARTFLARLDGCGVIDVGCSRGLAMSALVDEFADVPFIGIDASAPMVAAARERFAGKANVTIERADLRTQSLRWFASGEVGVILSVLTLQFIPVEHRLRVVADCWNELETGGAVVLVEKVLGRSLRTEGLFTDLYRQSKRQNGYSDEAIRRKATALEGVLVPQTARANEDMLVDAGFSSVECFWRWMNFAGWIAVKP